MTLVLALKDEIKDHFNALTKNVDLIKELMDKNLCFLLNNKTVAQIWTILESCFQHISSITITCIFSKVYNIKFFNYKDALN